MKKKMFLFIMFCWISSLIMAQHDIHSSQKDTSTHQMNTMNEPMNHAMDGMSHAFSLNLPMNRNGSGTGWLPDAAPMFGHMYHSKEWMFMMHYNLFLRYNNQDFTNKGTRGDQMVDAPNWLMFMGQKKWKEGLFHFNTMFSLDALIAEGGYPLLFQSGETYKGKPLVDRQHPHDLFSELSLSYSYAFSEQTDVFVYVAYPGEPALGPVAFMHRPSAMHNPDAPISHHWIDATHITFGVATLGLRLGEFKLEGSSFTGREPDAKRFGFDKPRFDSYSGRISYNPTENWAWQVSHAFLKSPEELHSGEDVNRTTASLTYSLPLVNNNSFDFIVLWGLNKSKDREGENALMLESSWTRNKWALYGKYEFVQKSSEELTLNDAGFGDEAVFNIHALTLGFNYDLLGIGNTRLAGGSQFTFYKSASQLNSLYGKNPMAFEIFLRFYPALMNM
jgi:hypothetical protein